ncbi:hypothetical protein PR202_gb12426 [Eleusine coracana subsp. coracana]|uniref:Uncharacterized protein n=1 Tax=Eleusine coracana subsp. coracana TaxID=191504 RepID=A0AAV5EQD5_ELECO|nr:hypothetical protein PR202_gb12426 [Eleusine coracana subsp. coracana]
MEDAAQTLVKNAGQLVAAEYRQLSGVGGEITELRDDLDTMNALLRMQSEAEEGAVDHFVRVWMKQMREVAYDAEDCIDLYLLRIKCRMSDGVFAKFKHLLETFFSRRRLVGEIGALRARAIAISERHARYGVNREALRRSPAFSATPMLTASGPAHALGSSNGTEHHQLVGIKCQADALVDRLKKKVDGEQHLKVFSIVGFGGVGKTTLAKEVCRLLEMEFPHQAMVSVSQAFDPGRELTELHKRIYLQVIRVKTENERGIKEEANQGHFEHLDVQKLNEINTWSSDKLAQKLQEYLNDKSIFPEDYEIRKDRLLCRWIAEGLVLEKRGLTLMEVAESYFDELVSRNMIGWRTEYCYYLKKVFCCVHDMVLEVMVSRSLECNFISLLGGQYAGMSYERIRRLSIHGDEDRQSQSIKKYNKKVVGHGINGMDLDRVRSFSVFQQGGQKLLNQLHKFTLLRVLDLEGCDGLTKYHMRCICRLYLLRFLSLRGTDITEVPPQIRKLEHVQTLDVRHTLVPGLPETVTELYRLERLQISHHNINPEYMWRLPPGLGKMKALREVGFSVLGNDVQVAKDVGELEKLKELSIYPDTNKIDNRRF